MLPNYHWQVLAEKREDGAMDAACERPRVPPRNGHVWLAFSSLTDVRQGGAARWWNVAAKGGCI
jgi:hypothetical protein